MSELFWQWKHYDDLNRDEIYDILALREQVFNVEQGCSCVEADYRDQMGYHLLGRNENNRLVCYLRVLPPGVRYPEHSIGRVICDTHYRGQGLGKQIMEMAHQFILERWENVPVHISAQSYLQRFYEELGYRVVSEPYMEEQRLHLSMVRG